jgi:hypothetical protein
MSVSNDVGFDIEGLPGHHFRGEASTVYLNVDGLDREAVGSQCAEADFSRHGLLRARTRLACGPA